MDYAFELSDDEKRELLRIAHATLREYMRTQMIPPGKPHRNSLLAPAAVFVTLRLDGALRGCIGTQTEDHPLYKAVQLMAVAAAMRDPRFPPLTHAELDKIELEISVLGNRQPFQQPDDLKVGVHGVAIEYQGTRGLLLPQVAVEQGWDAPTLLAAVARKAGLDEDAWKAAGVRLWSFTADVWNDTTHPAKRR